MAERLNIISILFKKMKLTNESGEYVADIEEKKSYMYDYFLQINLGAVNANARKED